MESFFILQCVCIPFTCLRLSDDLLNILLQNSHFTASWDTAILASDILGFWVAKIGDGSNGEELVNDDGW